MKKLLQLFLFLFILLIGIASCKKTNNGSPTNNVLLSAFIELDTTQSASLDTVETITYKYDNLKRLSTVTDSVYNNGLPNIYDAGIATYFYNGTDMLPYKSADVSLNSGGGSGDYYLDDTDYILPDGKDSFTETNITNGVPTVTTISVDQDIANGSFVYGIETNYIPSFSIQLDTVSQVTVNGDVVSQTDNTVLSPLLSRNATFSFDTHPNPFIIQRGPLQTYPNIYDIEDGIGNQPQKNNYTEINEPDQSDPTDSYHWKYQYTYNSNGYPATVVEYDLTSGSPVFVYKGFYFYQ
jgi:hypothetical protein